jgi:hypothetical protein
MSFQKPQFGPQNIAELLEAIFTCNGLKGPERCGSWEERTDPPQGGPPLLGLHGQLPRRRGGVCTAEGLPCGRTGRVHLLLREGGEPEEGGGR